MNPNRKVSTETENFLKKSADKSQVVIFCDTAVGDGRTVKAIEENLARNDDKKQIVELLLRQTVATPVELRQILEDN